MVILYTLFLSLPISTYPESWKLANVNPIRKKGSHNDITNSRPIYFLPITGRSWQGVFSIILWPVFIPIIFLCSNQSGFIPGHSCCQSITCTRYYKHNRWSSWLQQERTVFCDISKTFDSVLVLHWDLFYKLSQAGTIGSLLESFQCYLYLIEKEGYPKILIRVGAL